MVSNLRMYEFFVRAVLKEACNLLIQLKNLDLAGNQVYKKRVIKLESANSFNLTHHINVP